MRLQTVPGLGDNFLEKIGGAFTAVSAEYDKIAAERQARNAQRRQAERAFKAAQRGTVTAGAFSMSPANLRTLAIAGGAVLVLMAFTSFGRGGRRR